MRQNSNVEVYRADRSFSYIVLALAWSYKAIYGLIWPHMILHGLLLSYMAFYGFIWPYIVLQGLLWPFMAKYRSDWTCIVLSRDHRSKFIWSS